MRFRNKSPFLAAAKACVRRAAEAVGLTPKPPAKDYEHKPKFRRSRPSRKERIEAAKQRAEAYRTRLTENRLMWLRSVYDGSVYKAGMVAQQKGKHGDWRNDGRMEKRQALKAL